MHSAWSARLEGRRRAPTQARQVLMSCGRRIPSGPNEEIGILYVASRFFVRRPQHTISAMVGRAEDIDLIVIDFKPPSVDHIVPTHRPRAVPVAAEKRWVRGRKGVKGPGSMPLRTGLHLSDTGFGRQWV